MPLVAWPVVLLAGVWFDLVVLTALLVPVWIYEALLPDRWRASGTHRVLRFAWLAVVVFVLLFGSVAEATFWLEFATRFNLIAVDYLLYTHEVVGNIRESYPLPWILTVLALAALAMTFFMRGWLRHADARPVSRRPRNEHLATVGGLLERPGYATSFVYGGYGCFDNMHAYFSGNEYRVVDRVDFPQASIVSENVWAVADSSTTHGGNRGSTGRPS